MPTYTLKYYWEGTRQGPQDTIYTKLKIYQKDYSGIARQIGDLAGLSIGLNGGSSEMSSPICKSILTITLVDSRDKEQTPSVADSVKYGAWEEFFTPDATLYKVSLESVVDGGPWTRWVGYITPDSWEEDLVYRGQVSITARDNIGHLSDFDFDAPGDAQGMISLDELISTAGSKIGQQLLWDEDTSQIVAWYTDTNGDRQTLYLPDVLFDVEAFEGETWYDVLESIFESLGLCLRWLDHPDSYVISAIYKVQGAYYQDVGEVIHPDANPVFINRSGHRALTPAYKSLTDSLSFEIKDSEAEKPSGYVQSRFYSFSISHEGYVLNGERWKTVSPNSYIRTLDPKRLTEYAGRQEWRTPDTLMLRCLTSQNGDYFHRYYTLPANRPLSISFGVNQGCFSVLWNSESLFTIGFTHYNISLSMMIKWIPYDSSAPVRYLAGSAPGWSETEQRLVRTISAASSQGWAQEQSISLNVVTPEEVGYLEIRFYCPVVNASSDNIAAYHFARVSGLKVTPQTDGYVSKDTVTTIYDDKQNIILKRGPKIGQYPVPITAGAIKNTLYSDAALEGYPSIDGWSFFGHESAPQFPNLSLMIHKQLLCLHGTTMSSFSGEVTDASQDPQFRTIWHIGDKKCYLTGGSLDLISGTIQSAYLQEYLDYEDVWGEDEQETETAEI